MKKTHINRIIGKFIAIVICCICMSTLCFAHSGRTDSQGGHTDHSTGEYHYHHGYGPHQHPGGICPYSSNSSASSSSSSKSNSTSSSKNNSSSSSAPEKTGSSISYSGNSKNQMSYSVPVTSSYKNDYNLPELSNISKSTIQEAKSFSVSEYSSSSSALNTSRSYSEAGSKNTDSGKMSTAGSCSTFETIAVISLSVVCIIIFRIIIAGLSTPIESNHRENKK